MKIEAVSRDTVNQLFRPAKLQAILDEFMSGDHCAVRYVLSPGEYSNVRSAQSSFTAAINRLGYPVMARSFKGELYLIKINCPEGGKPK